MTDLAVTGASGVIGRHVVKELERLNIPATLASHRAPDAGNAHEMHRWVQLDIADAAGDIYERLGRPKTVLHLAWAGLPNYGSLHHFERELAHQYRFLANILNAGVRHLAVAGTCFEYGNVAGSVAETLTTNPTNAYGLAKDSLRRMLQLRQQTAPYSLAWGRLFYVSGEGQNPNSLFGQLETATDRGDEVFRMSGGEQLRDYLDASEMARALVFLATNQQDWGVVNICSGRPRSVRCLVENWLRDHDKKIALDLGHYPYSPFEPLAFWGDPTKLHQIIGSKP